MGNFFRLQRLVWILFKHKALFVFERVSYFRFFYWIIKAVNFIPCKKSRGERLAEALYEMGPIFTKIGQIFSTRSDLVGEEIALHLGRLRDSLPSFSIKEVEEIFTKEFPGRKIKEVFTEFNENPVAAASIAQVHKAKTSAGEIVAVKILRPNIEKLFKKDISMFRWLARLFGIGFSALKKDKLTKVIEDIEGKIRIELDFRMEAAAAAELKDNNKSDQVYIPEVFWDLTSTRVLTTEWIEGISIYDTKELSHKNYNMVRLSETLAVMFFNQAYGNGFFHADLHPGNVLVDKKGRICLVDFGIMGHLSKENRLFVAEVLYNFLKRDYHKVAETYYKYGFISKDQNKHIFSQRLRSVGQPIIDKPVKEISVGNLLSNLIKMADEYNIEIKSELVTLQKTIMMVEGISSNLNEKINMWELLKPWIEEWAVTNLTFDAKIIEFIKQKLETISDFKVSL